MRRDTREAAYKVQLMCGSWINEHIEEIIKEEFDLQTVPLEVKIDEHWEIGHGWSEDYES